MPFKDQKFYILIKSNVSIWSFRTVLLVSYLRNVCVQSLGRKYDALHGIFIGSMYQLEEIPVTS